MSQREHWKLVVVLKSFRYEDKFYSIVYMACRKEGYNGALLSVPVLTVRLPLNLSKNINFEV